MRVSSGVLEVMLVRGKGLAGCQKQEREVRLKVKG